MEELSVFKTFYSEEEANDLAALLQQNGIKAETGKLRTILDKSIIGDISQNEVYVKIQGRDFDKANAVINEYISTHLSEIDTDYYLNDFTNEELEAIFEKPDEWSNQDLIIARKLLEERGHTVNEKELIEKKTQRMRQLSAPETEKKVRLLGGYILSIFLPFYGVFYGLMLYNSKKLIPNGQRVPIYNEKVRNHAIIMVVISAFLIVFAFTRIFTNTFGERLYYIRL